MAERKPVVLVGGQLRELPAGDALPTQAPAAHTHANATPSAAGFLSAQDKAKLDALSITVSATAPTNPNIGDLWVDTST